MGFLDVLGFLGADDDGVVAEVGALAAGFAEEGDGGDAEFTGAFEGDAWVDARGMFMAADAAGPVYRLLGARDLGTHEFPAQETGLMEGEIAYRQHSAGHTPGPNWPVFLDYAGRYFGE